MSFQRKNEPGRLTAEPEVSASRLFRGTKKGRPRRGGSFVFLEGKFNYQGRIKDPEGERFGDIEPDALAVMILVADRKIDAQV